MLGKKIYNIEFKSLSNIVFALRKMKLWSKEKYAKSQGKSTMFFLSGDRDGGNQEEDEKVWLCMQNVKGMFLAVW